MKMKQNQRQLQNNQPIGIFDSGLGGLSVLVEIKKLLPNENFIYFGDSANVPYGEKSKEELISFSRNILDYFDSRNVKMALMACNTSSAVTLPIVKNEYDFEILGMIEPTARFLAEQPDKNIGIIATSATIKSDTYKNIISKYASKNISQMACPGLVELVEEERIHTKEAEKLIENYVSPLLSENVEKIVLGCTHYPFLSEIITNFVGKDILINPAEHLSKEAFAKLKASDLLNKEKTGTIEFYTSKDPEKFVEVGKNLYSEVSGAKLLELNKATVNK